MRRLRRPPSWRLFGCVPAVKAVLKFTAPPSKSHTQRALLVAALTRGRSTIVGPLDCDDSRVLLRALERLGVRVRRLPGRVEISGRSRLRAPRGPLRLGNAGTAVRFLMAACMLADGPVTLDGSPRMRRRPQIGLMAALRALGARIERQAGPGTLPATVIPPGRPRGGAVSVDPSQSGQFLSALLMIGPRLPGGLRVRPTGPVASRPYVDLTLRTMRSFGVRARWDGAAREFVVPAGSTYRPACVRIEGDHSSASYLFAAAALTGRKVRVTNLRRDSVQGDKVFPALLERLSTGRSRTLDMRDTPDIVPTVAACALFARGSTTIRGVAHLRAKESDRIAVLAGELRKIGAHIDELADGLRIRPGPLRGPATLDPCDDHRMAMAFGLVSLRVPGVRVADPGCVSKSYPGFWEDMTRFGGGKASTSTSTRKGEGTCLVLVGFRCTGKTTAGRMLAEREGMAFVDLDSEIERLAGRSVAEIFARSGEGEFRRLERAAVRGLRGLRGAVVATGGGVVVDAANRRALRRLGPVVWLRAPPAAIVRRLRAQPRPSLTGRPAHEEAAVLAARREPLYRAVAEAEVDAGVRSPVEVVHELQRIRRAFQDRDLRGIPRTRGGRGDRRRAPGTRVRHGPDTARDGPPAPGRKRRHDGAGGG